MVGQYALDESITMDSPGERDRSVRETAKSRALAEALLRAFRGTEGAFVLGDLNDPDGVTIDGNFNLVKVAAAAFAAMEEV